MLISVELHFPSQKSSCCGALCHFVPRLLLLRVPLPPRCPHFLAERLAGASAAKEQLHRSRVSLIYRVIMGAFAEQSDVFGQAKDAARKRGGNMQIAMGATALDWRSGLYSG